MQLPFNIDIIKLSNFDFLIYLLRWFIVGILVVLLGLIYRHLYKKT